MHDLGGNYILFLSKPGTTSYGLSSLFSYVSAKLRNALPEFIRTYELLVLKENPGPHFVLRLSFLMNICLNIMHFVAICICYVFYL